MIRTITIIADDYGLSPSVSAGIASLLEADRLTGTGCMTIFPEWAEQARRIQGHRLLGLHLTLTDHAPLTGSSTLAPAGSMPSFARLAISTGTGDIAEPDLHRELDAQAERFVAMIGREPDFFDGHQHVHFLPVVRRWLVARFPLGGRDPTRFVRGAPGRRDPAPHVRLKRMAVAGLAAGFDTAMRDAAIPVRGPLLGFYDWRRTTDVAPIFERTLGRAEHGALFMCHPGWIDPILEQRDPLVTAREAELAYLASDRFPAFLDAYDIRIRRH